MCANKVQRPSNHLVPILWSLLFAKCFALQYLVEIYQVPINSALYVWTLSILMAGTATVVYLDLNLNSTYSHWQRIRPWFIPIGLICFSAPLIAHALTNDSLGSISPLLCALLTINYLSHFAQTKKITEVKRSMAWLLASVLLFLTEEILRIGLFSACILLIETTPRFLKYGEESKAIKQAIQSLNSSG